MSKTKRSKIENAVLKAHDQARKIALDTLVDEAKRVLPEGWRIQIACGWGLAVYDDRDATVLSEYEDLPARLPRGVRDLIEAAAGFYDLFGPQNERITNKGVSYPPARRRLNTAA